MNHDAGACRLPGFVVAVCTGNGSFSVILPWRMLEKTLILFYFIFIHQSTGTQNHGQLTG